MLGAIHASRERVILLLGTGIYLFPEAASRWVDTLRVTDGTRSQLQLLEAYSEQLRHALACAKAPLYLILQLPPDRALEQFRVSDADYGTLLGEVIGFVESLFANQAPVHLYLRSRPMTERRLVTDTEEFIQPYRPGFLGFLERIRVRSW
jgi:hypothetical protein